MRLNECSVVVLSGGKGTRMGMSKGLIRYQGRAWIHWQIESLRKLGLKDIIVVLGHERERYPVLDATVVENQQPERGPFSSLVTGLAVTNSAVFVLPVDVPCPHNTTWSELAKSLSGGVKASVPRVGGHGGHPVLLSQGFAEQLLGLDPQVSRLDHELKKLSATEFAAVEVCDPRVGQDLNAPDDWDALS